MSPKDFRPSPLQDATAVRAGDGWTLVFIRDLPHPPARVSARSPIPPSCVRGHRSTPIATSASPARRP